MAEIDIFEEHDRMGFNDLPLEKEAKAEPAAEAESEADFLATYNVKEYPSIGYTADIIVFTIRNGKLSILLVERGNHPFKGSWALPGGFVNPDEDSNQAATRELFEETGLNINEVFMEQLKTYSTPGRDPRARVVSTAYIAFIPNLPAPVGGDDAASAHFFAVEDIFNPDEKIDLAFDHEIIIRDGLERAASKLEYTPLATAFLDTEFTMSDLRRVYEAVWAKPLHQGNFRRKVLSTENFVVPVGAKGESRWESGRTAELYTRGTANLLHPAILR